MSTDMQIKKLTKAKAAKWAADIDSLSDQDWNNLKNSWNNYQIEEADPDFTELRGNLVKIFREQRSVEKNSDYRTDCEIGFYLYEVYNPFNGFTTVLANDDDFWRYISCKVIPDLTYQRYPDPKQGDIHIAKKRFYSHTRRIWVKTLWWYIHLSWQGSREATFEVIKDCNVDNINKLFEQPGKGFKLQLSRELMRQYGLEVSDKSSKKFEAIQKRNLVNCRTVEPKLSEGAEMGYVTRLINEMKDS